MFILPCAILAWCNRVKSDAGQVQGWGADTASVFNLGENASVFVERQMKRGKRDGVVDGVVGGIVD